ARLHLRLDRAHDRPFHRSRRVRSLCGLCVRLRRANRIPPRREASGSDHRNHLAKRQCLRGRAERRLGPDPDLLERPVAGEPRRASHGVSDATKVSPDGYSLDDFYLARPGAHELQLDLFGDYKSNVALYPTFQKYFRDHKPPFLAVWGKNDPFFLPPGAEAFKRDIPNAVVRFFDTGHFALETHAAEIAAAIRDFLAR